MMVAKIIKSFTLWEFLKAHGLTWQYLFKPMATTTDQYDRSDSWA